MLEKWESRRVTLDYTPVMLDYTPVKSESKLVM